VHSFIEPHLFDNNVLFDNTTPIYLINLHYFSIFSQRITKTSILSSANFTEGNILLKQCTQTINNKIKLHILGMPINKLGN